MDYPKSGFFVQPTFRWLCRSSVLVPWRRYCHSWLRLNMMTLVWCWLMGVATNSMARKHKVFFFYHPHVLWLNRLLCTWQTSRRFRLNWEMNKIWRRLKFRPREQIPAQADYLNCKTVHSFIPPLLHTVYSYPENDSLANVGIATVAGLYHGFTGYVRQVPNQPLYFQVRSQQNEQSEGGGEAELRLLKF